MPKYYIIFEEIRKGQLSCFLPFLLIFSKIGSVLANMKHTKLSFFVCQNTLFYFGNKIILLPFYIMKKCPFCAEEIKDEAIKCKHCWSELDSVKIWATSSNNWKYKEKNIAAVLALFLWGAWIHKFYLWKIIQWILYLVFIWTFIPAILGVLEWISYLSMKKEDWDYKFNNMWEKPTKKKNKSFTLT